MTKYSIHIDNQCHEDWSKMVSQGEGKYCNTCTKVVTDFTGMTDQEIIQYLLQNKQACGRFYKKQLTKTYIVYHPIKKHNWPAISAMLVAGLVSISTHTVNAFGSRTAVHYIPTEPEKNKNQTEPEKKSDYKYTVRLFDKETNQQIKDGYIYIDGVGSFNADKNGNIIIEINQKDMPDALFFSISAWGFEQKDVAMYSKDLKGSGADVYLEAREEEIMTMGVIHTKIETE